MKSLSNTLIAALIALVLTIIVAALPYFSFFESLEASTADLMMKLNHHLNEGNSSHLPDSHLVFVNVDEDSVQAFGRWPFPRNVHGDFLKLLSAEKPKVVGWDILFTEQTGLPATAPAPAAPAPDPNAPPAATTSTDPATAAAPLPALSDDDYFAQQAALFQHLVTGAKREIKKDGLSIDEEKLLQTANPKREKKKDGLLDDELPNLLPTKPITNITGDTSHLLSEISALFPFPDLRKVSYFGFVDEDSGKGGVRRTMPLAININGIVFPSLDLQIIMQFWEVDPDKVTINIGKEITLTRPDGTVAHIPIDEYGYLTINYRARLEDFNPKNQAMSYALMGIGLANKQGQIEKPSDEENKARDHLPKLADNIVVVGVSIAGTDAGVTPLDNNSPLVATHLNVLNNILQNDFLRPLSAFIWVPIYAVFLFVAGNLMLRVGIAPMIPIGLLAMVIVGVVAFAGLWLGNLQIPVAGPEFGLLVLASVVPTKRFFGEEREKRRVRSAMSAYLSEKVMNKVLEHPDGVKLGGSKQEITVMFCDIRGFTKYCDDRDPQEVLTVVNEYFEEMTQVVFKYDGTVDKYIGDCIMAFWNAPQDQPDHAQRAVCCAMDMRYALANFKTKRAGKDTELFECGIGIHTGEALVGNMGSSLKLNYTAMGSTVNMAARLEALTKRLNERILISQATLDQLQGDFTLTDRGEAMVPGFANPIHVYAVGAEQDITSALKVGKTLASSQDYTADEVTTPIWEPAPLPKDADPEP